MMSEDDAKDILKELFGSYGQCEEIGITSNNRLIYSKIVFTSNIYWFPIFVVDPENICSETELECKNFVDIASMVYDALKSGNMLISRLHDNDSYQNDKTIMIKKTDNVDGAIARFMVKYDMLS